MSEAIKILVSVEPGVDPVLFEAMLAVEPAVQIVGLAEGLDGEWDNVAERSAELLLVACNGHSEHALAFIDANSKQRPDRPVIVLSDSSSNGYVKRVFAAGADDIVSVPESPAEANGALTAEIVFTLRKAVDRRRGSSGPGLGTHGALISVLGPKGGIGKTLTSANLAVALALSGQRVVVVDLDLQFGDVALALGLSPEKTIYDLATSSGTLDSEKVESYLATHESGARVLIAPIRPDQASVVTVDLLREIYPLLRSCHDYVVVDTPPGFTPEVIASVDASTAVCMVGMLDSLSLKNTWLGLETLELMGYPDERVRLVLNRADTRVGITRDDVTEVVGRPPDVMVPSDREIARSVNEGKPIVLKNPRSDAARAFMSLAAMYTGSGSTATRRRLRLRRKAA
jgi:pilus assembly protein CpaE